MLRDLNEIWRNQGISFMMQGPFFYDTVEDVRQYIQTRKYDSVMAVLPENSNMNSPHSDDTHEKLKRQIDVPSQCIHWNNTLPEAWAGQTPAELWNANPRIARRIMQTYQLCLSNLLVKHHWVPFAPADRFHYNLQIGIDIGGMHNNRVMACMGYGFRSPKDGLIFRCDDIPVETQQVEPIPATYLYSGLLRLFESIHADLLHSGVHPDFNTAVFYRDGRLLGDRGEWDEKDALVKLHAELTQRGWLDTNSLWTAVEVMKAAEGWRVIRTNGDNATNPIVGFTCFPFTEDSEALVCTTGSPYLTQGTACPVKLRILDVFGKAVRENVVRDFVWQADMCFTKIDMGMSLPWVLHVADAGALQAARSYKIAGITA